MLQLRQGFVLRRIVDQALRSEMNSTSRVRQDLQITMSMNNSQRPAWPEWTLRIAALYNLVWGATAIIAPLWMLERLGMNPLPNYPEFWQCIGMIVGVYGVGYWIAASDPVRFWPLVLVGLLGKILGPIGFLQAILAGRLPLSLGWTILTNDLVWWVPFGIMLRNAARAGELARWTGSGRGALGEPLKKSAGV
jgi:hypothetical protein